jgi:Holliday junction resolvase-like predicted endonuclease
VKLINNGPSRTGDIAEHYAITWLWDNGYEVFKNTGSDGAIDLVAWNKETDEFLKLDVKTMGSGNSGRQRSLFQKQNDVRLVRFDKNSRELRFVEHRK